MNFLGVNSLKRRAKRLAERPKCGMLWRAVNNVLEDSGSLLLHQHKCYKVSRHATVHTCHCGAQRVKKP